MPKLLFIYNPNAGKGSVRREVSNIIEKLTFAGYLVTTFPTSKAGDAREMALKRGSRYDCIVCSGGDGTLHEVINGMMGAIATGHEMPHLGYIPAGTVNDFASNFDIPKDVNEAVDIIINGTDKPDDIGSFDTGVKNRRFGYFTYVAAFGAFTEVAYETPQETKNVLGKAAYSLEGFKRFQTLRPYHIKVTYDDTEFEDDFIYGMITNSKSVGGFQGITGPSVYLDDGKFDVILVKNPRSPMDLQDIINSLLSKDMKTDNLYHFHTGKVTLASEEKIPWTLDGESGGVHQLVTINDEQQAISIIVPDKNRIED